MKKELKGIKKNHIMIGALALMIAVAGYLNFSAEKGNRLSEEEIAMNSMDGNFTENMSTEDLLQSENLTADISDLDSLDEETAVITSNYLDEEMAEILDSQEMITEEDIYLETENGSMEIEDDVASGELTIDETPGEAVFTGGTGITSLASARLLKEQTRAQERETLMSVINSNSADDTSKQQATDSIINMTQRAEKETAAEILLEAKGFTEVIVSITGDSADVVVGMSNLSEQQCAQIIDAVSRKTDIPASNIIITPTSVEK